MLIPMSTWSAAAASWAGLPAKEAMYIPDLPMKDRSEVCLKITFNAPKFDYKKGAFWSIATYSLDDWTVTGNFAMYSIQLLLYR